jgi:8-amino-7-oxononanoate synthase
VNLENSLEEALARLDQKGLRRSLCSTRNLGQGQLALRGQQALNLAGNDYLGLASNVALLQKFYAGLTEEKALACYGLGSGASRLMTGNHEVYQHLEEALARCYGREKALIFNSGWHLNSSLLPALARKDDVILADKLCHASLIDGMRLALAQSFRYSHLDYNSLAGLLRKHCTGTRRVFVVTESIFSMDGDCASLPTLLELTERYGAILYVDEAHAVGVRGRKGLGLAEEQGVLERIDFLVGTFGKAWAGQGAFVLCGKSSYDFLVNTARGLIFTTALPPVSLHWLSFLLPKIQQMDRERQDLAAVANTLRTALQQQGLHTRGTSQIVPVLLGEAEEALRVAASLQQQGFWVQAVRPPTVPQGTARLRLSITHAHRPEQLASLPDCIAAALHGP